MAWLRRGGESERRAYGRGQAVGVINAPAEELYNLLKDTK